MKPRDKALAIYQLLGGPVFAESTGARLLSYGKDGSLNLQVPRNKKKVNVVSVSEQNGLYTVVGSGTLPNSLQMTQIMEFKAITKDQLKMVMDKLGKKT